MGVVYPRAQIIDYTSFTYYLEVGHKTRKPIPVSSVMNIFRPFTYNTWIAIVFSLTTGSLVFFIISKFGPYSNEFDLFDFFIMPTAMIMESSMFEMGWFKRIRATNAGILMLGFWTLCIFVLLKYYESNLLASLLAKTYEKPVDSFQGMYSEFSNNRTSTPI